MSTLAKELGFLARRDLSLVLNQQSPRGNDWRGLVDKMGFSYQLNMVLSQQDSPTLALLEEWERTFGAEATLDRLIGYVDSLGCQEAVEVLRKAKADKRERVDPVTPRGSVSSTDSGPVLSPRDRGLSTADKRERFDPVTPRGSVSSTDSGPVLSPRDRGLSTDSTSSQSSLDPRHHPLTPCNSIDPSQLDAAQIAMIQQSTPIDPAQVSDRMQVLGIRDDEEWVVLSTEAPRTRARSLLEESLAFIQSQRYDVFLSFAKEDEEFAEELRQRLKIQAKMDVFVPSEDLMPGKAFSEQVADMIKSGCRKTVVILSPDYIKSEWCSYEARLAHHQSPECRKHILIPILFRTCKVPAFMAHIYYLDYPRYKENRHQLEEYFWKRLYKSLSFEDARRPSQH